MRLDKFLKVSRLIKRRTLAKEVCDQGRISINGQRAKAGSNVKAGDELLVRFGQKLVTVTINEVKEMSRKEEAAMMYTIVKEERINQDQFKKHLKDVARGYLSTALWCLAKTWEFCTDSIEACSNSKSTFINCDKADEEE